ncbi:MAG: leucyl/phenylalanyl-tRNA--protein transferase [Flavobacteriaceae bacterium]
MIYLSSALTFPKVSQATEEGLLALGGDLSPKRLLLAYRSGIFPWYEENQPILWWSPNPRMVLFLEEFHVSKSFRKTLHSGTFTVTFNQNFSEVVRHCAQVKRTGQKGTWITQEMTAAYQRLHELGHALSVEVWNGNRLVGGLYGVDVPEVGVFCGESMFSLESNASKVGLYHWVEQLKEKQYQLIDCQVFTEHLHSLGAREIPREVFMGYLKQ